MAKEREQRIARILYIEQKKDAKEISKLLNVSETTLSKWVNKFGWRDIRNVKISSPTTRINNIKQIINDLSEQRLSLNKELKELESQARLKEAQKLRTSIAQIDDAVSKWNKTLETINKENKITLSVYLAVMELIFQSLRQFDVKLFMKTIDFQEMHLNDVSIKFK